MRETLAKVLAEAEAEGGDSSAGRRRVNRLSRKREGEEEETYPKVICTHPTTGKLLNEGLAPIPPPRHSDSPLPDNSMRNDHRPPNLGPLHHMQLQEHTESCLQHEVPPHVAGEMGMSGRMEGPSAVVVAEEVTGEEGEDAPEGLEGCVETRADEAEDHACWNGELANGGRAGEGENEPRGKSKPQQNIWIPMCHLSTVSISYIPCKRVSFGVCRAIHSGRAN